MGKLFKIPYRFFNDHCERGLPTPEIHHETRDHYWIHTNDPALGELIDDATHYTNAYDSNAYMVRPARALLAAIQKAGI
jgi:hypothetical protein